jgi:hypothetical protein
VILKGKERGNAKQLATYLLTMADNEHVELHDLRGFSSNTLKSALQEIGAVSRGTRAKNSMFSLSLNPPPKERVSVREFEEAIEAVERKLGLENQPRAVVFHEKDGRRHAHVVWSRIDAKEMKAINLPHFKMKLTDASRQLFLDHGWQLPKGLISSKERDPAAYSRAEWQQAVRAKQDPKALKTMFQECWAASDSAKAFQQALQARGYTLAHGDRRGHVAVDFRGEVFAIAKWTGQKTKSVRARLGDENALPSIAQVNANNAKRMTDTLRRHIAELERSHEKQMAKLSEEKTRLLERQRKERTNIDKMQSKRWKTETAERSKRLSKGLRGVWHRLTGEYRKTARLNEREALQCLRRDRLEKDRLIGDHLDERKMLNEEAKGLRLAHTQDIADLHREIAGYTIAKSRESRNIENRDLNRQTTHERSPKPPSRDR